MIDNAKTFHSKLRQKMDDYAHLVYSVTKKFPKEEVYGITSQLRRASLSVVLNYVEGFARDSSNKNLVYKNFLEVSFGSLKESQYLVEFSFKEKILNEPEYRKLMILSNELGAMIWGILRKL